jgi:hypothetical protein
MEKVATEGQARLLKFNYCCSFENKLRKKKEFSSPL